MKYQEIIFENETPQVVYHGTSRERWAADKSSPDGLYVTTNYAAAKNYAEEWRNEDEHPIIIEIKISHFEEKFFGPNQETAEQYKEGLWNDMGKSADELTWLDTMKMNGTFVIHNFSEIHKSSVRVIEL